MTTNGNFNNKSQQQSDKEELSVVLNGRKKQFYDSYAIEPDYMHETDVF